MPGKIVAIKVKVGDRVNYGDELCVLEAMKMEQSIRATQEGVVKEIKVSVGQVVSYGSVLIEFE
jgi:biotin carboxyl carrier protein